MKNESILNLLKEFKALSISEREKFIDFVSANSSPSDFKFIVDTKLADGIVCPHCGAKGKGVCKNGVHSNGRPRFICKHCGNIIDIFCDNIGQIEASVKNDFNCDIDYTQVLFFGTCPKCKENK